MKVLVCKNKHCRGRGSEELLKEFKKKSGEHIVDHSSCMTQCETGPNVYLVDELKQLGGVSIDRIEDVFSGKYDDLVYKTKNLSITEDYELYSTDSMHLRTIKLFRYHLEKYNDLSVANLRDIIREFKLKYDITGIRMIYPVRIALIDQTNGPDLPKLIHYLGKERTIQLFDNFLKKAQFSR